MEGVLEEAGSDNVPLLERIKFLSIYSSNLDEFYRVRMPAVMALEKIHQSKGEHKKEQAKTEVLLRINKIINEQQERFGAIFTTELLPLLKEKNVHLLYNEPIPENIKERGSRLFLYPGNGISATGVPALFRALNSFRRIIRSICLRSLRTNAVMMNWSFINIPSDNLPRFYTVQRDGEQFVVFLDDIIKDNLSAIFKHTVIKGCYSFKITRDAELEVEDDYEGDVARKIEEQLSKRDFGLATRLLHEPGIEEEHLQLLAMALKLQNAYDVHQGRPLSQPERPQFFPA